MSSREAEWWAVLPLFSQFQLILPCNFSDHKISKVFLFEKFGKGTLGFIFDFISASVLKKDVFVEETGSKKILNYWSACLSCF